MFEDSLIVLMIMMLLGFIGMLTMFLFISRSLTVLSSSLKEQVRQQQIALADLERQLMDISFHIRSSKVPSTPLSALADTRGPMTDAELSSLLTGISAPLDPKLLLQAVPEMKGEVHNSSLPELMLPQKNNAVNEELPFLHFEPKK